MPYTVPYKVYISCPVEQTLVLVIIEWQHLIFKSIMQVSSSYYYYPRNGWTNTMLMYTIVCSDRNIIINNIMAHFCKKDPPPCPGFSGWSNDLKDLISLFFFCIWGLKQLISRVFCTIKCLLRRFCQSLKVLVIYLCYR